MQESNRSTYPLTALVVANSIPVVGVLFFGWDVFNTMVIYWWECVMVAVITVLKMIKCSPIPVEVKKTWTTKYSSFDFVAAAIDHFVQEGCNVAKHNASKIADIGMFAIVSGGLCYWYGYLLVVFVDADHMPEDILDPRFLTLFTDQIIDEGLVFCVIGFAISHMVSFFREYIGGGEYRRTVVLALFVAPLGRFVLLHVALVCGFLIGLAIMFSLDDGTNAIPSWLPVFVPVVLIVSKTVLDIRLHLREHERYSYT